MNIYNLIVTATKTIKQQIKTIVYNENTLKLNKYGVNFCIQHLLIQIYSISIGIYVSILV